VALNSANVRRWAGSGAALVDLDGNGTLPTDATTVVPVAFDNVGYLSDSGVTISQNSDTQQIFAWQNGDNVRTIQSTHDLTFAFEMLESNDIAYEVFFGDVATGNGMTTVEITGAQPGRHQWVIQAYDEDQVIRVVIPAGQVTDKGDVMMLNNNVTMFPVTLTAYPDSDGVKAYIYQESISES
jgi:hypothetical protein